MISFDLDSLHKLARNEGSASRRTFLAYASALSSLPILARQTQGATKAISFSKDPFSLGVASGDPTSSGVVLWTRLAPDPLIPGGGLPPTAIDVSWEIAEDEAMTKVVRRGQAVAPPQLAHSVHVEVEGLKPDRWYWYRFRAGDAESRKGRTRTLPRPADQPEQLRFAFASCQHYETGLYTAYDHMVKQELDLIFHLGDYIYEGGRLPGRVREHPEAETESLEDYRTRYALYKSDPMLQAAHTHCPWFVTWDDHEVANNYAGSVASNKKVDALNLLARRANAYQAYYESMPLRGRSVPTGPDMRLYRKASFGRLAEFLVLDTRQYRSDQVNNEKPGPLNDEAFDPNRTMLGQRQKGWMESSLLRSNATWNVLAQQVMMAMVNRRFDKGEFYSMDQWPGYAAERRNLVKFLEERRVPNPVILTGDIHSHWANEVRLDDRNTDTPIVATEFVGTSISSGGKPKNTGSHSELLAHNPCVRFHSTERGYVQCTVSPKAWQSRFIEVEDVTRPGSAVETRASFVVEAGRPGLQQA